MLQTLARKTKVSIYKRWREKKNCHIWYFDVLHVLNVTWTKLKVKQPLKFKTALTNANCKIFLGLEQKYKHGNKLCEDCLNTFLSTHIPHGGKILEEYQGRERQGWRPVWLLYQSLKLRSALSEIVSLAFNHQLTQLLFNKG